MREVLRLLVWPALAAALWSCATPSPVQTGRHGFLQHGDEASRSPSGDESPPVAIPKGLNLRWPLKDVKVTSPFGRRGHEFHEGVDLHAAIGTPVYAAEAGTILYAGRRIRGYGNMVVIRHTGGFNTVYAHNSRLLVRRGQTIHRGQKIAISGKTGHVRGAHLHFEIRNGVAAIDPLTVMPPSRTIASER